MQDIFTDIATFEVLAKQNMYWVLNYIYMGLYIYIYGTPPPKTHIFWQFTAICGILLFFSMFKCVFFFGVYFIFSKNCVES